jgi:nucleoside-diphosphate-sugar epimerase
VRVLLTGATGFIGSALAERLARRGDRVRALARPSSRTGRLRDLGIEVVAGDLGDRASLDAAVDGCDAVLHLAGAVKALRERDFFAVNAEGTDRVVEACASARRRPALLYVSSLAAAGPAPAGRPRTEEDEPAPVSRYGESKLAGERAVRRRAGALEASIVRPPVVYGPGDRELVPSLVRMARLGVVPRLGEGERLLSIVHVADLCQGILAVLDRGRRLGLAGAEGVYFLDDGPPHGWDEVALAACAAWGARVRLVTLPGAAVWPLALGNALLAALTRRPTILSIDKARELGHPRWTCSSDRARRELGYAPRLALAEGMRDAVAWLRASEAPGAGP